MSDSRKWAHRAASRTCPRKFEARGVGGGSILKAGWRSLPWPRRKGTGEPDPERVGGGLRRSDFTSLVSDQQKQLHPISGSTETLDGP